MFFPRETTHPSSEPDFPSEIHEEPFVRENDDFEFELYLIDEVLVKAPVGWEVKSFKTPPFEIEIWHPDYQAVLGVMSFGTYRSGDPTSAVESLLWQMRENGFSPETQLETGDKWARITYVSERDGVPVVGVIYSKRTVIEHRRTLVYIAEWPIDAPDSVRQEFDFIVSRSRIY